MSFNFSDNANSNCEECGGEGICDYDDHHGDAEELPCQVCYPPSKGQLQTEFEDFVDYDDRDD